MCISIQSKSEVFCRRVFLPPCMSLFLHNTIYLENILCFFAYRFFATFIMQKCTILMCFRSGYFAPYISFSIMSDQKQNCLSFGQKRQIVCLLDEGVSHFVDRLDSFCTYLSSIVDSIDNIRIYICLIVVDLEQWFPTFFEYCTPNAFQGNLKYHLLHIQSW